MATEAANGPRHAGGTWHTQVASAQRVQRLALDPRTPRLVSVILAAAIGVQAFAIVRAALPERPRAIPHASLTVAVPRTDPVAVITRAHLFGAAAVAPAADSAAPFQLTLAGTLATDDPERGLAIIRGADNKARLVRASEQIDVNTRLLKVFRDHAVLLWQATERIVWLPRSDAALALLRAHSSNVAEREEAEPPPLAPGEVEPVVRTANYYVIAEHAEFLPQAVHGKYRIQVTGVKDEEALAKVGLHEGDVIVSMHDQPFANPAQITELLAALSHGAAVEAVIVRDGETVHTTLHGESD